MNDLTNLPPNSPQSRPTWSALSEALKRSLLDGRFSDIADSPVLLAEAQAVLPALRRDATWGASAEEIMAVLAPRFALYPQPDRSTGEWDAWWADYTNALDDLPPSAIEAGMAEYVKLPDSEFFPKPGKLRELAKTTPNPLAAAVRTLERAVSRSLAPPMEFDASQPPPEPTEGDKAKVRAMLAGFQKTMADRAPPKRPVLPPTPVKVDEAGLSSLMRERMGREGG